MKTQWKAPIFMLAGFLSGLAMFVSCGKGGRDGALALAGSVIASLEVGFDNLKSKLSATNVQDAIDELAAAKKTLEDRAAALEQKTDRITFELNDPAGNSNSCVVKDLKDLCADGDGCQIKFSLQYKGTPSETYTVLNIPDAARLLVANLVMEGPLSSKTNPTIAGYYRRGDYREGSWEWGNGNVGAFVSWPGQVPYNDTHIENAWNWFYISDGVVDCPGLTNGEVPPYSLVFKTVPKVAATVTILD